jgi:alpha-L-rhamnosidase
MTFYPDQEKWLEAAERLKPELLHETVLPTRLVRTVADADAFQGWRMEADERPLDWLDSATLGAGESFILDFGEHRVGRLRLRIESDRTFNDAPVRLKLIFAEVPAELVEPLDPYTGWLSRNWFQDEQLTVDDLPVDVNFPRRYAFRYVRIEVVGIPPAFRIRLRDIVCETSASVPQAIDHLIPAALSEGDRAIATASIRTLRDCMQTVFEDGPKRDRRLWIGDLRLQALANSVSYRNFDLVKRCLYLFAGVAREDGLMPACLYETPKPRNGQCYAMDYPALFSVTLSDYVTHTGDEATGRELLPIALRQLELLLGYRGPDGTYDGKSVWWFIDWHDTIERQPCIQGLMIYCINTAVALAKRLGMSASAEKFVALIPELVQVARTQFVAGKPVPTLASGQVSWGAWAWLTKGGVLSPKESALAFDRLQLIPEAIKPGGPYLMHYCIEALMDIGRKEEALQLVRSYWSGMLTAGLDTFPEVWDRNDPKRSPYGSYLLNSYCHAWSCTPVWFFAHGQV